MEGRLGDVDERTSGMIKTEGSRGDWVVQWTEDIRTCYNTRMIGLSRRLGVSHKKTSY